MAKHRKRTPEDRAADGERWRKQMSGAQETLPSLVWQRVWTMFKIDLSDPKQASAEQVHALLWELMGEYEKTGCIDVQPIDLEACVDCMVPKVFGERK